MTDPTRYPLDTTDSTSPDDLACLACGQQLAPATPGDVVVCECRALSVYEEWRSQRVMRALSPEEHAAALQLPHVVDALS